MSAWNLKIHPKFWIRKFPQWIDSTPPENFGYSSRSEKSRYRMEMLFISMHSYIRVPFTSKSVGIFILLVNLCILQNSMHIFNFQLNQVDRLHSLFSPVQITLESVFDLLRLLHDFACSEISTHFFLHCNLHHTWTIRKCFRFICTMHVDL